MAITDLEIFENTLGIICLNKLKNMIKKRMCDIFNKIEINQNHERIPINSKRFELGIK